MSAAVVVIGAGLAAWNVVKELRKRAPEQAIVLVTEDAGESYSKPMLSTAWAQAKSADQLVMSTAETLAEQLKIELHTHATVQAIDRANKSIKTAQGEISYHQLVLAVGAVPVRLALDGASAEDILSINHLDDYRTLRARVQTGDRLVILGGGLIGCEFANDWAKAGYAVTVIDPAEMPLASLLPAEAGEKVRQGLLSLGVVWKGGVVASSVKKALNEQGCACYELTLNDGSTLYAEHVISAVGLRPNTALAQSAGLTVSHGIVVDRYLRTNDHDIYALGDCAEVEGAWQPYVMPIMQASRALAATLAGEESAVQFPVMPVLIKTPASPVIVWSAPRNTVGQWSGVALSESDGEWVYLDEQNHVRGFALVGAVATTRRAAWVGRAGQYFDVAAAKEVSVEL